MLLLPNFASAAIACYTSNAISMESRSEKGGYVHRK